MCANNKDILKARALVGPITEDDLRYVDYYVSDNFGIFIPSVGFCQYATQPRHTHPAYSFILFFSGEQNIVPVEIEIKPEHYLVSAMAPEVPHEEEQTDTFTRYIAVMISRELYETQYAAYDRNPPGQYLWDQFLVPHDIMLMLKKFMAEFENRLPGNEQALEALALIITHQIIRGLLKIDVSPDFVPERFEIGRVTDYLHQNYGEKLSVGRLAKTVNMSESHFIRTFKKETGMAPMEYLIRVRLDKAKKLLRAGAMSITEISLLCGFNSISHFSSSFTKHEGIAPSEYQSSYSE
ncbi:MAG: AraC family transcriptional regulator [Firmicutes bacterium HGW-Firmicutes-14]|nr:MAG: AraC family transcriptional regulator [Firmicutes bacterium HGW-Firmicutes-14]